MNLKQLTTEMPFKWREQSVNAQGATMVAYIDARQLFDKLDEVVGAENWQSDYKIINGNLYGGIAINVNGGSTEHTNWVWKWDCGTESNVDKEKGEASDAIKRAGVQWGVGRFLYSLGIVKLKSAEYNGKYRPADDSGNIIWDRDKLTELCNQSVKEGKLDRTKLKPSNTKTTTAPPVPTTEKSLPWLNKTDPKYAKAVEALKAKTTTVDAIKKSYKLSKELEKELSAL